MRKLIYAVLLVGIINIALKMAIVVLLLAGLIFRTKETVGLLALFALIAHPLIGLGLIAAVFLLRLATQHSGKHP
jgi:hypothetical protein